MQQTFISIRNSSDFIGYLLCSLISVIFLTFISFTCLENLINIDKSLVLSISCIIALCVKFAIDYQIHCYIHHASHIKETISRELKYKEFVNKKHSDFIPSQFGLKPYPKFNIDHTIALPLEKRVDISKPSPVPRKVRPIPVPKPSAPPRIEETMMPGVKQLEHKRELEEITKKLRQLEINRIKLTKLN